MPVHFTPRPGISQPVSVFDSNQLATLRRSVTGDQANNEDAQRKVAEQFEALFIQQLLKKARETTGDSLFDSNALKMTQAMGDEQMALNLARPGFGLADALIAQMKEAQGGVPSIRDVTTSDTRLPHLRSEVGQARTVDASSLTALIKKLAGSGSIDRIASAVRGAPKHVTEFVNKMREAVQVASDESGVPAKLIMSQAALESGWGKREIKLDNGQTSHNLFGIKATGGWAGKVADITTSEFVNGKMVKMKQPFRAYDSYADSLTDYARLLSENPRYRDVLTAPSAEEAAHRVQQAGYATDPSYAEKLISIMSYFDAGAMP